MATATTAPKAVQPPTEADEARIRAIVEDRWDTLMIALMGDLTEYHRLVDMLAPFEKLAFRIVHAISGTPRSWNGAAEWQYERYENERETYSNEVMSEIWEVVTNRTREWAVKTLLEREADHASRFPE